MSEERDTQPYSGEITKSNPEGGSGRNSEGKSESGSESGPTENGFNSTPLPPDSPERGSDLLSNEEQLGFQLEQVEAELVLLYEQLNQAQSSENLEAIKALRAEIVEALARECELERSISGNQTGEYITYSTHQANRYIQTLFLDATHMLTAPEQLRITGDTLVLSGGHLYEFIQLLLTHPTLRSRLEELVNSNTVYQYQGSRPENGMLMTISLADMVLLLEQAKETDPEVLRGIIYTISQELRNSDLNMLNQQLDLIERMAAIAPDDMERQLALLMTRTRNRFAPTLFRVAERLIQELDQRGAWSVMPADQTGAGGNSMREMLEEIIQKNKHVLPRGR
jgi:hypothetical protein